MDFIGVLSRVLLVLDERVAQDGFDVAVDDIYDGMVFDVVLFEVQGKVHHIVGILGILV